ncbi:Transcription termination factor like [Quillaja saponaria]|uniref:Transcription termination factor like n=1 Tax=Quillaja saponaria TaxID=32244 RepID=A0AAD7PBE2_QUISA|nr:Transcription termination factor like [Quillaja saponaria]
MAHAPLRNLLYFISKRFLATSSPSEVTLSTSKKLGPHKKYPQKPESVLKFLKSYGFNDTHIARMIARQPQVLKLGVDKILKPKIEFLVENGIVGDHLPQLLSTNPRSSWILGIDLKNVMQPNIDLLTKEGVPIKFIVKLTMGQPRAVMVKVDKMMEAIETAKKLGLEPATPRFVQGKKIRAAMDFYLNTMNLKPETVISYPAFLTYGVDTRLRPR